MKAAELSREELASAKEWGAAVRRHAAQRARELHRCNAKAKILAAVLRELAGGAKVVDRRALRVIARAAGVERRHVRRTLARLEKAGEVIRVLGRGVRLKGQRGHMTSAIVVPALFPMLELLRPARAAFARARMDLNALRLELEAVGVNVPVSPPHASPSARLATIGAGPAPTHPPAPRTVLAGAGAALSDAVQKIGPLGPPSSSGSSPHRAASPSRGSRSDDRLPLPPPPPSVWIGAEGRTELEEVGPTARSLEASPAGELAGLRPTASSSGAVAGDQLERQSGAAGERRRAPGSGREGSRPTVPEELRGGRARPSDVAAALEEQGLPRGEAVRRAYKFRAIEAARRGRAERGEEGGRQVRPRTVARELAAITRDRKARDARDERRARGIFTKGE